MNITAAHRAKAFAVMCEIADHSGYAPKGKFYADVIKPMYNTAYDIDFSLSEKSCTLEEYDMFMEFVIELALTLGVQFNYSPKECFTDTDRYLILMIKNRTCCITGHPNADIHHTIALGMGVDRTEIDHSKYPRMALSREYHQLAEMKGQEWFDKEYCVHGVFCKYHSDVDLENGIDIQFENSDIKLWKYQQVKNLLGVRFKDGTLVYYRMDNKEHEAMMMAPNSIEWFYTNVYGIYEEVKI